MMKSLIPNLMINNIPETLAFYCDTLGFDFVMGIAEENTPPHTTREQEATFIFAMVQKGAVSFMLQRTDSLHQDVPALAGTTPAATVTFYIEVDDVQKIHDDLNQQVPTVKPLDVTWYGQKEWYIADPDGYIICLASKEA